MIPLICFPVCKLYYLVCRITLKWIIFSPICITENSCFEGILKHYCTVTFIATPSRSPGPTQPSINGRGKVVFPYLRVPFVVFESFLSTRCYGWNVLSAQATATTTGRLECTHWAHGTLLRHQVHHGTPRRLCYCSWKGAFSYIWITSSTTKKFVWTLALVLITARVSHYVDDG